MTGRLQSASKRLLNQPYALMWAGARSRAQVSHPAACLSRFFLTIIEIILMAIYDRFILIGAKKLILQIIERTSWLYFPTFS